AMSVRENRSPKSGIRGRAFGSRPAIVRARDSVVDLLGCVLAYVVDEHPSRLRLKGEREWIAQAHGPYRSVVSSSRIEEGIVGRNGPIRIDTQYLSEKIGE